MLSVIVSDSNTRPPEKGPGADLGTPFDKLDSDKFAGVLVPHKLGYTEVAAADITYLNEGKPSATEASKLRAEASFLVQSSQDPVVAVGSWPLPTQTWGL